MSKYKATATKSGAFFIQKRLMFLGLIPIWVIKDGPIKDLGQKDEVVRFLNNPNELDKRIAETLKELNLRVSNEH